MSDTKPKPLVPKTALIDELLNGEVRGHENIALRISEVREDLDMLIHHTQHALVDEMDAEALGHAVKGLRAFQELIYVFDAKGRAERKLREQK